MPAIITEQAKIKVIAKDVFGNEGTDESDADFIINGALSWITVQGIVKDITTGLGLAGVTLNLIGQTENYTVISQSNGSFTFGSVRSGYYNLSGFKNGYQSYNEYVLIHVSSVQTININLSPGSSNSIVINPSLTAYADNITESPADFFYFERKCFYQPRPLFYRRCKN